MRRPQSFAAVVLAGIPTRRSTIRAVLASSSIQTTGVGVRTNASFGANTKAVVIGAAAAGSFGNRAARFFNYFLTDAAMPRLPRRAFYLQRRFPAPFE
jgi:hypothetical protein